MSAATYAERADHEARAVLQDVVDAGGVVNVRFDAAGGARLAVRFDLIDGPAAVRLFIAYRTAQQARPDAIRRAALSMLQNALEALP